MPEKRLVRYRGVWCLTWTERGRTKRRSLGTTDRAAAETAYQGFLAAGRRQPKPTLVTVADCLAGYLQAKPKIEGRKALSYFGPMLPEHIDRAACENFTALRVTDRVRPKTIHTELGLLRTALIWAEREGWIGKAPYVHRPDPGQPRDRWLTPAEAERLRDGCAGAHIRLFVDLALQTAARPGAILDLTWDRVSFDLERIDFNPSGRARTRKGRAIVPMTPGARQALEHAHEARTSPYVVEWAGGRVSSIKKGFARACERAGLEGVTPNTLRHTAATWMAEAGVAMREISLYMGHSSTEVTERVYAKHSPDYLKGAAAALQSAQFPLVQMNDLSGTKREDGSQKRR